jgi:two-component system cell cycle sensor histidine kinase/response regulator CckA
MSEGHSRPTPDAAQRGLGLEPGRLPLPASLALLGVIGIAILALAASRASEPLVLTLMAALATVGVFFLFALAGRHVHFGSETDAGELYWSIIEADEDGIEVSDGTGRVLALNRAYRKLAGTGALGEVNSIESLLSREPGGPEAMFRLTRAAERGSHLVEELELPAPRPAIASIAGRAQEYRSIRVSVQLITPPGHHAGAPVRLWRLRDITADKLRQEQSLQQVETRLQRYVSAPVGIISATADGRVEHINSQLAQWLGHPPDGAAREQRLDDLVADGGAQLVLAAGRRQPDSPQRFDLDLVDDAGRRWPATLSVTCAGDRLSIAVLPRGRGEEGLATGKGARHEQRFSRLFQSAPFGIAAVDSKGAIVGSNTAFARLVEGSPQRGAAIVDVLGKGDPVVAGQVAAAIEAARNAKASIPTIDITLGLKSKEQTRQVHVAAVPRSSGDGAVAVLYMLDTSEARSLEHRIAQAQKMEAVGTLAGGIAHDFNNVLTAIIGFSDLLLQTHKPGNPSYAHILSVKSSANRAAGLVRQLLAFSRRQTLQPKVLQMGDVLTDLSMLMNRLLGEKIELKIVSGRDLWFVRADPSEIERTIINLAVNARDAMLPRGGRLTVRTRNVGERESQKLEAHGVARGEYVMIEVEDTGTGMTPEVMAKIFDPFFTTKAVGKGTGLGLASVYGIIKQTGGYIFPESTPGVGTVFRMLLPRYHVEPEEERAAATAAATAKPRARDLTGSGRVLLVEDEDAVRRFAVAALKSKGYEVLQAADGIEALEVMKAHDNRVDLVVSDVIMPEMDGPTLMKELRKTTPDLKFIFVSGYPDDAFKNNLDPDAEFTFMPKPYSLAQIAAKVKEVIGR